VVAKVISKIKLAKIGIKFIPKFVKYPTRRVVLIKELL
jgi:hypothetical protein